jgi:type I restriction enzyme S subunit
MAVKEADLGTGRTGGREATTGVIPGRVALSVGCPELEPPKGWKWTSLSSVAQLESGHTPSRKHPEYWDGGIPWIGIKDATGNHGRTLSDTYQHVSALGLENSSARLLPANTVCLSRTASVGFVVVMGRPMATSQDFVNWVCGPNIEPHYLKYVLLAENEALWRFASGTTHQTIYYPEAKAFHVCLPPLAEQKAIAAVLGALDDKIEVNRRMNATLEAMARTLFQSWFVDFDPVRAKLDGREPVGLDKATAALFPSSFDETAAGHIPHGWRVGSIYEIANVIYGAPFASSLFNSERLGKPLIRIRDLPNESPAVFTTEVHPRGYLLQLGDIAVGMDGEFRAYLWAGVESWLNQRCCVFAPKPGYSAAFVRNSVIAPLAQVEATETATTVIHLGKNDIDRFTVIIPDAPVTEAFKRLCQPWYDQIVANKKQSRTLATLRDTLLPKLLSGELSAQESTN